MRELASSNGTLDLLLPAGAVEDERRAEQGEADAGHLIRPLRHVRETRNEVPVAHADSERGQPTPPPREVRALVGQSRTTRGVGDLLGGLVDVFSVPAVEDGGRRFSGPAN